MTGGIRMGCSRIQAAPPHAWCRSFRGRGWSRVGLLAGMGCKRDPSRYWFPSLTALKSKVNDRPQGAGQRNEGRATQGLRLESWFHHIPGLSLVMPSTPYDAKGLLKSAIRDENAVLFIEHKEMYAKVFGPVPEEEYLIPLGVADVKRPGKDVTIVAYSRMVHFALAAAALLEKDG